MTALKQWHITQGFTDPTIHPLIRKTLRGIQQIHGKPKAKPLPITLDILQQLIEATDNRLIDLRNRVLLLIGFFGAFRRGELVSLEWEWIRWIPEGIEVLIPRSKTGRAGVLSLRARERFARSLRSGCGVNKRPYLPPNDPR